MGGMPLVDALCVEIHKVQQETEVDTAAHGVKHLNVVEGPRLPIGLGVS